MADTPNNSANRDTIHSRMKIESLLNPISNQGTRPQSGTTTSRSQMANFQPSVSHNAPTWTASSQISITSNSFNSSFLWVTGYPDYVTQIRNMYTVKPEIWEKKMSSQVDKQTSRETETNQDNDGPKQLAISPSAGNSHEK